MSRVQIIIISVGVIIVWMAARRLLNRGKKAGGTGAGGTGAGGVGTGATGARGVGAGGAGQKPRTQTAGVDEINRWYQDAREQLAMLDNEELGRRERTWEALTEAERLSLSEDFLRERFGPKARQGFTRQEKLEIGKTSLLVRPLDPSPTSPSTGA